MKTELLKHNFYFPDEFSYKYMINEIFVHNCYNFMPNKKNPFIIDCGANIGLSTIWFKTIYPTAKILAFEPSSAYKYLKKNTAHLKKIELRKEAVGNRKGKIFLYEEQGKEGSLLTSISLLRFNDFKNKKPKQTEVKCIKLSNIIIGKKQIDLLKLDIEGAEYEVINDLWVNEKLQYIDNMIIEFHNDSKDFGELNNMLSKLQRYITARFRIWFAAKKNTKRNIQDILLYCRRIKHGR